MSRDPHLVRRRGRRKWYIVDGDRRISTGAEDRAEAQRILDAYRDAKSRPLDPTVAQMLDIRMADAAARGLLTIKNMRQQHRQLRRFFGHMRAGDITPATAIRYIEARSPARTASRRELEELVTAYKTIGITLPKLPLPPNGPPRDEVMTRDQVHTLLAACKSYHLRLWCLIALTTARRKSAILDLTWDRVDLGRGILDFDVPGRRHTKKRRGVATIPGPLLAALRDAQEIAVTPYVIEYCGKRVADIGYGFRQAVRDAGLPRWVTPHVLKHTAISWLAEEGYSVDQIADMTQTSVQSIRYIYKKVNAESLRDMSEDLASRLFWDHRATFGKRKALKRRDDTALSPWCGASQRRPRQKAIIIGS